MRENSVIYLPEIRYISLEQALKLIAIYSDSLSCLENLSYINMASGLYKNSRYFTLLQYDERQNKYNFNKVCLDSRSCRDCRK